jgi:hypothetical protein
MVERQTGYFGRCEFSHHGIGNLVVDAKELARPISWPGDGRSATLNRGR